MRKAKPRKRILLPDPKFNDVEVTRFVNNLMLDGKKSIAYTIFYDSLELVGKKMKDADKSPLEVWKQALVNASSIQLIPTTVLGLRSAFGSTNPSSVLLPTLITTVVNTVVGIMLVCVAYPRKVNK